MNNQKIINSIKYWLKHTVIGCNFCPFAKKEFVNETIRYQVSTGHSLEGWLVDMEDELKLLEGSIEVETTIVIFPKGLESFFDYLDLLAMANELLTQLDYEGKFQLASFHPDYCFEGVKQADPSNYTNRSPYPIIHILREDSLSDAVDRYKDVDGIPKRNIELAQLKGDRYFKDILTNSYKC